MQRLWPVNLKRLLINYQQDLFCLQNLATTAKFIDHCKYCAAFVQPNCRRLTLSAVSWKVDEPKIKSKVHPSRLGNFTKDAYSSQALRIGENQASGPNQTFSSHNGVIEDRYQQKWSLKDNRFHHTSKTYQKFQNKDKAIENRYQQGYKASRRYTARPLESYREEEEFDASMDGEMTDVDEADVFGTLRGHAFNKVCAIYIDQYKKGLKREEL